VAGQSGTLKALRAASKGLLFPSESDRPVKAFTWTADQVKAAASGAEAVAAVTAVPPARIKEVALADFFQPVTAPQPWHSDEEKADLQRFQELEKTLTTSLQDPKAYRVEGDTPIDVYVVGKDTDGNWSGVSTQLVET